MKTKLKRIIEALAAMLLIGTVICATALLSVEVKGSALYRQSRVLSMLLRQEPVGIAGMLKDTRNIDMTVKFAGALTAAYINFELIPVNEAATFAAVFESLPDGVDIEGFEYRRRDLYIMGTADKAGYDAFLIALRERGYFSNVTGSRQNEGNFEITCIINNGENDILYQAR